MCPVVRAPAKPAAAPARPAAAPAGARKAADAGRRPAPNVAARTPKAPGRERKRIPGARKIGGEWRIRRDVLLQWLSGSDGRVSRNMRR